MRLSFVVLVVLGVASVACGKTAPREPSTIGVSKRPDTCTTIPHGCPGTADDDGCPDVLIEVGNDCKLTAKAVGDLQTAASEMLNEAKLTRLLVVAPTIVCANIVRAHLETHGVTAWRVIVAEDANRSFVSFQVDAWMGRDCRSGAAVKAPPGQE